MYTYHIRVVVTLLIAFLVIGLLAGCSIQEQERESDDIYGIDEPVIVVNGEPIRRREIEVMKIYDDVSLDTFSLRENIDSMIRDKVILQEARRQDLHPSQDRINDYIEPLVRLVEEGDEWILAIIEGLGQTKEEFFAEQEKLAYDMFLKEALWLPIYEEQRNEIEVEAIRRNVDYNLVVQEFYERFVDELVENADIEILDPEIRELLQQ